MGLSAAEKKPAKGEFKFVGIGNCYNCHKGGQFEIWMASSHFKAYDTLATDKAKEVARKRCVSCHNAESDPDFDFKKAFPKFAHSVPEAEGSTN